MDLRKIRICRECISFFFACTGRRGVCEGSCICPGYGAAPLERMSGCARCEKPGKAGAACPEEEE